MAEDVMRRSAADAPSPAAGAAARTNARRESRADRARRLAYRKRFVFFYVVLAIVAGGALGTLVVLVGRGSPGPAPAWSRWEPTGSTERRAAQIGDRVSDGYRLASGNGLATATYAGPPTIANQDGSPLQIRALAVQTQASGADEIDAFAAGSTVMYILCGRGAGCSIAEGQASAERDLLLRREALELSLYSFEYLDGIETVLVLLPPRAAGQPATAVFLERADLRRELSVPLSETLTAPVTPGIGELPDEERRAVDRLTRSRVYAYSPLQQQDGSFILVLAPTPG